MKRKLIGAMLIATTLLFVGCGNDSNNANTDTSINSQVVSQDNKKEETVAQVTEVLLDNEIAKVTMLGVDNEGTFGPELKLEIENKTNKTITIQAREISVDGMMAEPTFSCEISGGKKAKDSMSFMASDVSELKNIEGIIHIFDSESWDGIGDYSFSALMTESSEGSEAVKNEGNKVLLDNEIVKISYTGQNNDSYMGPGIELLIENKTDNTITVQGREISVDGYMIEPIFSCDVSGGKKAKDSMTFMKDDVTELKNIEGLFHIFYSDSWDEIGDYPFNIDK